MVLISSVCGERFNVITHMYILMSGMIMEAVAEELKLEQSSPLATAMHAQASQQQQQQQQQQQSPTAAMHFSFSRTNSTGSVHAISCSSASSAHNTG